ncbi:MAG TPA: hypothetical protein V6D03_16130 [Candidatus Caenarcaniphilales bacterium]
MPQCTEAGHGALASAAIVRLLIPQVVIYSFNWYLGDQEAQQLGIQLPQLR